MTPLSAAASFLSGPGAWPSGATVERIDTHLSWVFRCGDQVYKLKKPTTFARQDLCRVEARHRNCEDELRLNRRFSDDVYLDVLPVCRGLDGALRVDAPGEPVDWLLRMRRLPDEGFLDRQIAADRVDPDAVRRALAGVVRHLSAATPAITDPEVYLSRERDQLDQVIVDLRWPGIDNDRVGRVVARLRGWVDAHEAWLVRRVAEGRIVDGHGDLRPQHVCLDPTPAVIDCLEFDASLRTLDAIDDLGFLALECEHLGASRVAATVMDAWRVASGDAFPMALLEYYQSVRALRRASVAAMRLRTADRMELALGRRLRARAAGYIGAAEARAARMAGVARV